MSTIKQIQIVATGTSVEDIWVQDGEVVRNFECDKFEVRFDGGKQHEFTGDEAERLAHAFAIGAVKSLSAVGVFGTKIVRRDESTPRAATAIPVARSPFSVPVRGTAAAALLAPR